MEIASPANENAVEKVGALAGLTLGQAEALRLWFPACILAREGKDSVARRWLVDIVVVNRFGSPQPRDERITAHPTYLLLLVTEDMAT
jgi:hypothetical protein